MVIRSSIEKPRCDRYGRIGRERRDLADSTGVYVILKIDEILRLFPSAGRFVRYSFINPPHAEESSVAASLSLLDKLALIFS
jgi:hypothetical protein